MTDFKEEVRASIKELTNEQLVVFTRLLIYLFYQHRSEKSEEALQVMLDEIYSRPGCCDLLLPGLEEFCARGIVKPYFVLLVVISCELMATDATTLLKEKITTGTLRDWIETTYATKLSNMVVGRIQESDIDWMEENLRKTYAETTENPL